MLWLNSVEENAWESLFRHFYLWTVFSVSTEKLLTSAHYLVQQFYHKKILFFPLPVLELRVPVEQREVIHSHRSVWQKPVRMPAVSGSRFSLFGLFLMQKHWKTGGSHWCIRGRQHQEGGGMGRHHTCIWVCVVGVKWKSVCTHGES